MKNDFAIIVISPGGQRKEYKSIHDFWRKSKYSLESIRHSINTNTRLKDGTKVRRKNVYRVLAMKENETLRFTSQRKLAEYLGCHYQTVRKHIESGEPLNGWYLDIL